jgi:ABC-type glycerol-3-phosphate transport system substrate-binding protein
LLPVNGLKGEIMIRTRIASFALAASLFGGAAVGTVAAQGQSGQQAAGAAGIVAAVLQANVNVNNTDIEVDVVEIGNSLNNLTALNNVLNNNDVDITVYDVSVLNDVNVLSADQIAVLNGLDVNIINNAIGIGVLTGGDLIVFTNS